MATATRPKGSFTDMIADARISLDFARDMAQGESVSAEDRSTASRMLDSIAIDAANLRATIEGLNDKQRAALVRKVRRALGYTYP